jgi:transcriptional regulator with XRE-family HTH domain
MKSRVGRLFEQGQGHLIDYSSILVEVGARLRQERERRGMNQTDFAALANTKRGSQLEYESGKRPFDAVYLLKLIANGIDSHFVLTGQRSVVELDPDQARIFSLLSHMDADDRSALLHLASLASRRSPAANVLSLPSTAALADAFGGVLEASPGLTGDELAHELATRLPIIVRSARDEIAIPQSDTPGHPVERPADLDDDRRAAQPARRI